MDEISLRVFVSLCETENTRDTAADLAMSQSGVSRTLARLENELGVALFARDGRRLRLNRAGATMRAEATRALGATSALRRHAHLAAQGGDVLRVGFLQSTATNLLPALAAAIRESDPAVRVDLRQGFHRDFAALLEEDGLDLALTTAPRLEDSGLHWVSVQEQPLCVAVARSHALVDRDAVTLSDIAGEAFVAFAPGTELRAGVDRMLQDAGVRVDVVFESAEIDTIRALVGAGFGVSVVPRTEMGEHRSVRHVPLVPARTRGVGLAWPRRRRLGVDPRELAERLRAAPEGRHPAPPSVM